MVLANTQDDVLSELPLMEQEIIALCEKHLTQKAFLQFNSLMKEELENPLSCNAVPFLAHQLQKKYIDYKLELMLEQLIKRYELKIECFKEPFPFHIPLFDIRELATVILKSLDGYFSSIYEDTYSFKRILTSFKLPNYRAETLDFDQLLMAIDYINALNQYYAYVKKETLIPIDPEEFDVECMTIHRNLFMEGAPIREKRFSLKKIPACKGHITEIQLNKAIFENPLLAKKVGSIACLLFNYFKEMKPKYIEKIQPDVELGVKAFAYLHAQNPISYECAEKSGLVEYFAFVSEWLRYDEHILNKHILLDQGFKHLLKLEKEENIDDLPSLITLDYFIYSSPYLFEIILMQIQKNSPAAATLKKWTEQIDSIAKIFIDAGIIQSREQTDKTGCPSFETLIYCLHYIIGALNFYMLHQKLYISQNELDYIIADIRTLIQEIQEFEF